MCWVSFLLGAIMWVYLYRALLYIYDGALLREYFVEQLRGTACIFSCNLYFQKKIFLLKYVWILLWAVGIKNQLAFDQEGLNHV